MAGSKPTENTAISDKNNANDANSCAKIGEDTANDSTLADIIAKDGSIFGSSGSDPQEFTV
jgi:hypothetical protein